MILLSDLAVWERSTSPRYAGMIPIQSKENLVRCSSPRYAGMIL